MSTRKDSRGRVLRKGESQRQDGRYAYVYTDKDGFRRTFYADTLQELRKKEDSLTRDVLDGIDSFSARHVTLNELFDRYIKTKTKLRETTRTNYIYMYDRFVRKSLGKKAVFAIKYSDVLKFYSKLLEDGMKLNTLDTIHTVVHPSLEMAVRDDIIRINPSSKVMSELKRGDEKKFIGVRHALTVEQQRTFINFCRNSPMFWRWHPLFTVMLGTGCRVGEIVGLRWQDIDLENRIISINHSMSYHSRNNGERSVCEFKVSLPKTEAGIREIPMMDRVHAAFLEEKEFQEKNGFNLAVVDGMSGFIFQNRFGTIHTPSAINRAIERIREHCNAAEMELAQREKRPPVIVPHFTCHHLRHTFCTRFCENESNLKVIQSVMGHADIETTMNIYAEATNSKKKESLANLSKNLDVF